MPRPTADQIADALEAKADWSARDLAVETLRAMELADPTPEPVALADLVDVVISDPPTQAEVQAIATALQATITALKAAGVLTDPTSGS